LTTITPQLKGTASAVEHSIQANLQQLRSASGVLYLSDWLAQEPVGVFGWEHSRWKTAKFVESRPVEALCGLVVLLNSVLIGIRTDDDDVQNDWLEVLFISFFVLEIGVKIFALHKFFWQSGWLIFDFVVVLVALVEMIVLESTGSEGVNLSVLRMMRTFRVLRLVGRLKELNRLVTAFLAAMSSVMWVMVLMFLAFYMFGVIARTTIGASTDLMGPNDHGADGQEWWGSLPKTMVTLMQMATFDSWISQIGRPTSQAAGGWVWLIFLLFGATVSLGLLNLLTAVFIDSLLEENKRADQEKKTQMRQQKGDMIKLLESLFEVFDQDKDKTLDVRELIQVVQFLGESETVDLFEQAGLDTEEIIMAIRLADRGDSEEVAYEDFVNALETLHDSSTKRDIWMVQLKLAALHKNYRESGQAMLERLDKMEEKMHADNEKKCRMMEKMCQKLGIVDDVSLCGNTKVQDAAGSKSDSLNVNVKLPPIQ